MLPLTAGAKQEVSLRNLVEQIGHADQVGLDSFGVGEHHRREFLDSAPAVILRAAAARTHRIRLTSAVTVLSAADPVRSRRRPDHHLKTWPVAAVIVPSPVTLDIVRR